MKKKLYQIKLESELLREKTDEELQVKIEKIKKQVNLTSLDSVLTEWFALVQEISYRKIGLKHYETQLLAGIYLHDGKIVEMKTGEGKTLSSTLPVSLNALTKKGVHLVTVNDYLAERDKNWMGKIYNGLNLSVGLVKSATNNNEKRKNYDCDITYLTNSELVFDYLRDTSALYPDELVQRPFNYCIIDEIDSILIDEARTPLIISAPQGENNIKKLTLAKILAGMLQQGIHFEVDEKRREINLTEKGYQEVKERLGKESLYDLEDPWILDILNALKAKYIFKLNKDYIVLNNKIVIVDEFTGRIMEDRRWSMGIHESIEIKENLSLGNITKTKTSITYQNFFTLYPKFCGMTGTAKTAEKEFKDIYNLEVVVLPTAKPMIRKDFSDLVYQTELSKWKAVLSKSKECFEKGQPILIGTASVEKSEFLADLFSTSKIPYQILNAKPENINRESEIVAQAGEPFAVTIATNMAGRGTDIILGGNPSFKVKQLLTNLIIEQVPLSLILKNEIFNLTETFSQKEEKEKIILSLVNNLFTEYSNTNIKQEENKKKEKTNIISFEKIENLKDDISNLPYSLDLSLPSLQKLYDYFYKIIYLKWEKNNLLVKQSGGLFVLGTERHETRRIDNQLRGRSGRQGDPGFSQFFVSLDDELIKIFGGDSIRRWLNYLMTDMDVPLESNFLTQSLEKAQEKVELYNYEIRKNVFQYDEILNLQRKQLFEIRTEILSNNLYNELALRYSEFTFDEDYLKDKTRLDKFLIRCEKYFSSYSTLLHSKVTTLPKINNSFSDREKNSDFYSEIWITNDLRFAQSNFYQLGFIKKNKNTNLLSIIDFYWTEHLERMNYIRDTINWRAYGQQNPLIEYNTESFRSYKSMLEQIRFSMLYYFLENSILNIKSNKSNKLSKSSKLKVLKQFK